MAKSAKKSAISNDYTALLVVFGRKYTAKGATPIEAIAKLSPGMTKAKAILSISHGNSTKERVLMPMQSSRLFNTMGMTREIALKNVSMLFDGL